MIMANLTSHITSSGTLLDGEIYLGLTVEFGTNIFFANVEDVWKHYDISVFFLFLCPFFLFL
jgi:hypothetical protein